MPALVMAIPDTAGCSWLIIPVAPAALPQMVAVGTRLHCESISGIGICPILTCVRLLRCSTTSPGEAMPTASRATPVEGSYDTTRT